MAFDIKKTLRRRTGAVALAFGMAAAPAAAHDDIQNTQTYWKTNIVDAVITLYPCEPAGVCSQIVWINDKKTDVYEYFGDPAVLRQRRPTVEDVQSLCGFSPRVDFERTAANRWEGTMEVRGKRMTLNMRATLVDDRTLQIVASKAIFSKRDTWRRVEANDPRYPDCRR